MFNFEPQEKYLAWIPEGKKIFLQYGLCGKELPARKSQKNTLETRIKKLRQFYPSLTYEDESKFRHYYENGFGLSGICYKPKGHAGPCENHPWKMKKFDQGTAELQTACGFKQKITAGTENDGGGNGDGSMNRAGSRWWPIQATKAIRRAIKDEFKKQHGKKGDGSIYLHQNLASGPYMAVLANFDMLAQCSQVTGFYDYFDVDDSMKQILKRRFDDLVHYFDREKGMYISTEDDRPQCPMTHTVFELSMFGRGSDDDNGVQFGHVEPKVFDQYMTKPGNVCMMTREGNSWQGNRSVSDTYARMRRAIEEQARRKSKISTV